MDLVVVILLLLAPFYMVPTGFAVRWKCSLAVVFLVGLVNLLIGWTGIGWLAALGLAYGLAPLSSLQQRL